MENSQNASELKQEEMAELFHYAKQLKEEGQSDQSIRVRLLAKNVPEELVELFIAKLNEMEGNLATAEANSSTNYSSDYSQAPADDSSGGGARFLIYIGILLFINLLSYMFDWPFWIY